MNVHQSLTASRPLESFSRSPESVADEVDAMVRFEGVEKTYPAYRGKPSVRALQNIGFRDSPRLDHRSHWPLGCRQVEPRPPHQRLREADHR